MTTQIRDGLWHVDCQTLDKPNVYIIDDGDVTLVDAGWTGDEPTVREGLHTAGFQPAEIDRVLLTHYDPDHIGTLSRLTPELDAPIYIHKMEAPYIAGDQLPPWTSRHGLKLFFGCIHNISLSRISPSPLSRTVIHLVGFKHITRRGIRSATWPIFTMSSLPDC